MPQNDLGRNSTAVSEGRLGGLLKNAQDFKGVKEAY